MRPKQCCSCRNGWRGGAKTPSRSSQHRPRREDGTTEGELGVKGMGRLLTFVKHMKSRGSHHSHPENDEKESTD